MTISWTSGRFAPRITSIRATHWKSRLRVPLKIRLVSSGPWVAAVNLFGSGLSGLGYDKISG